MPIPEMKQEGNLRAEDFQRYPVWIGVHNFDIDQPWYEQSDEETYRPWTGPLPFSEERGIALLSATFVSADGRSYPGYIRAVRNDWDQPQPMLDKGKVKGTLISWSEMHGGAKLSLLLLQSPVIFLKGLPFDFQLRIFKLRGSYIQSFYAAIEKRPRDVFPMRFAAESKYFAEINSGTLKGFFSFPLWNKNYEIDTGESYLREDGAASAPSTSIEASAITKDLGVVADVERQTAVDVPLRTDISLEDIRLHPVWARVQTQDEAKSIHTQYAFRPWTGILPVDSSVEYVRVSATFILNDGDEYPGYIRAVPENWADIIPPPTMVSGGGIVHGSSPKIRFGNSPSAIIGEHQPCLFVSGRKFWFWGGARYNVDELRLAFYEALGKTPDRIFPIRFHGTAGLATGILTGEIDGFYKIVWKIGKAPQVVR